MSILSLRPIRLLTLAILITASGATIATAQEAVSQATPEVLAALGESSGSPVQPAAQPKGVSPGELQALLASPEVRAFRGLSENAWDFNDPTTIPGFGTMPVAGDSSAAPR